MLLELLHGLEACFARTDVFPAVRVEKGGRVPVVLQKAQDLASIRGSHGKRILALVVLPLRFRNGYESPFALPFSLPGSVRDGKIRERHQVSRRGVIRCSRFGSRLQLWPVLLRQGSSTVARLRRVCHRHAVVVLQKIHIHLDTAVDVVRIAGTGNDGQGRAHATRESLLDHDLLRSFLEETPLGDLGTLVVFDVAHKAAGVLEEGLAAIAGQGLFGAVVLPIPRS